jgi:NADH:ubiquinone oxidoreductase subunit C
MKLKFLRKFLCKTYNKYVDAILIYGNRFAEAWLIMSHLVVQDVMKKGYFFQCGMLNDIVVVDWLKPDSRFEIIYNLFSLQWAYRLFFKIRVAESQYLMSMFSFYKAAYWLEREVWDMFGIFFLESPDLRRILTDYGFEGYPLRKDFPLTGFLQVRFDDEKKCIVYEPVELAQEYRDFDFMSGWEDV